MNSFIKIVPNPTALPRMAVTARRGLACLALVTLLGVSPRGHATLADCELEESHYGYGEVSAVESWSGGGEALVLVGSGSMLQIYDLSDPAAPTLLGERNVSEAISHIAIAGDGQLAAVASHFGGITLVDIADRAAPTLRGFNPVVGRLPGGMAFDGDLLHVAVTPAGLRVLDVSEPDAPLELAQVVTMGTDNFNDVAVRGQYVYAADDLEGVTIWDVSTPSAPVLAGSYPAATTARHIRIIGDRAFVARQHEGFDILDLSNPTAPVLLGSVAEVANYPQAIVAANGYLVLPELNGSLRVIDVGNPAAPTLVATLPGGVGQDGFGRAAAIGNRVVAAGNPGLRVVDVSTPATPAIVGTATLPGVASQLHVDGGRVYVGQGDRGLAILGNTAANRAMELGRYTGSPIYRVVAFDNIAVGHDVDEDYFEWLRVLDVSDAAAPQLLTSVPIPTAVYQFSYDGGDLFVVMPSGLHIYDMTNPSLPLLRSTWTAPDLLSIAVLARGDRAYVGTNGSVHVLDVTDRDAPMLLGSYAYGQPVADFAVHGNTLFVAGGQETLHALDVSAPAAIVERSVTDISPGLAYALALDDDRLYIATGTFYGTLAYDVSDPADPLYVEQFATTDDMRDVGIDNEALVVAESGNGVRFFAFPAMVSSPDAIFADGFESVQ